AEVGELAHQIDQTRVEKLSLVDADDLDVGRERRAQRTAVGNALRGELAVVAGDEAIGIVAVVGAGLEHLDVLAGDARSAQTAPQLLALAREHAAGDDLDGADALAAVLVHDRLRPGRGSGLPRALTFT